MPSRYPIATASGLRPLQGNGISWTTARFGWTRKHGIDWTSTPTCACLTQRRTRTMRKPPGTRSVLLALVLLLAGCAAGGIPYTGSHLTPTECRDLAALRTNAPTTMAQHHSELAALRKAGYNPSPWYDDPYYPDDLQAAQRLVDYWFQTECQHLRPG